jgi:PAS domain S-box-containing protein
MTLACGFDPVPGDSIRLNMKKATEPDNPNPGALGSASPPSDLRRRAEARLKAQESVPHSNVDQIHHLHELEVRQIELAIQNDELRTSLAEVEKLNQRCGDFFDFAPVGYFSLERTGVIAQTNLVGARLLALECASLPGKHFGAFVAEADQPVFNDFLKQVFTTEARQTCEVALARKDRPPVFVQIAAMLSPDKQECRAVVEDITARRGTEEALRHEQVLFQSLAKAIPDHIYFKDRQSRFVRINDTMAKIFGLSDPGQAIGKTDFDFFTEEHARQAFDDEQRLMRTGASLVGFEEKETWPDGHVTWASTTKVPLRDAKGKITGMVGISRDITEHKRMEAALAEQAETYRALFSTAFDGVVEVDGQLHIVDANRVYCRLLGYTRAELVGQRIQDVEGNENHEQVKRHMQQMQREGGGRFETRHRTKDGRLIDLELNVTFIPDRGRFIAFCHDITERKRAEEALRPASADALAAKQKTPPA